MTEEHKQKIKQKLKGRHLSTITEFKKGHKFSPEILEKIKQALKGNIPWNKGLTGVMPIPWNKGKKEIRPDVIKKMSEARRNKTLSEETKKKISQSNRGKKKKYKISKEQLSKIRKEQYRKQILNGKHPRWKGGITPLVEQIRHCFKYRQWRSDVFTRDDFTCQNCGIRGSILNAHHIKEFNKIIEENNIKTFQEALDCDELWNINNGETLCKECHKKRHLVIVSGDIRVIGINR